MTQLNTVSECRDRLASIQTALSDYYNGRGGAVYGENGAGNWIKLAKVRLVNGNPYGEDADGNRFVLRGARTDAD
jgi:hypothetical protein